MRDPLTPLLVATEEAAAAAVAEAAAASASCLLGSAEATQIWVHNHRGVWRRRHCRTSMRSEQRKLASLLLLQLGYQYSKL